MPKDAALNIRVDRNLRDEFLKACARKGLTASDVLRDHMKKVVQNAQTFNRS